VGRTHMARHAQRNEEKTLAHYTHNIRSTECPLGVDDQRESYRCFYQLSPTGGGEAGVPNPALTYPPSPFRESTVVSVALGGRSLPVVCRGAGGGGAARAHCWRLSWMLAQAASVASRYAFGADGVGAARPGACGQADRRLALRARHSALRAQRRSPICVLHIRAPSASSACKGCSWCSARGAQLRRGSAGRSARTTPPRHGLVRLSRVTV